MERIERHLGGRFSHRLRTDASHHLTRVHNGTSEDFLDRRDELVKANSVEAVLADNLLRTEVASEEDLEQHQRVLMSLINDRIILQDGCLRQHTERVDQFLLLLEEVDRVNVRDAAGLDVVARKDIGDHSRQVDGHGDDLFKPSYHDFIS